MPTPYTPPKKKQMTVVEFARLGGKARAKKMTKEQRQKSASNAAKWRWGNKSDLPKK